MFPFSTAVTADSMILPDGWKPFAALDGGLNRILIVARKWHRAKVSK